MKALKTLAATAAIGALLATPGYGRCIHQHLL